MTVTNFQGEARAYLEKLIEACGAKFTRNMTTENTHLIAASYPPPFSGLTRR
jgi:twin BRCT domain